MRLGMLECWNVVVLRLLCFTCLVFNETECEAAPALAEDITLDDRSAELTAPAEARNIVKCANVPRIVPRMCVILRPFTLRISRMYSDLLPPFSG